MTYMKAGSQFLYDDDTHDIVGVKDKDGGETMFLRLSTDSSGNTVLVGADGQPVNIGTPTKIVAADGVGVSCPSGTLTAQGISSLSLVDTHSLVDTINGTITVPSDATLMSIGIGTVATWPDGLGTYREIGVQQNPFPGVWLTIGFISVPASTTAPQAAMIVDMLDATGYQGVPLRFYAKQDSGGALTPANLRFIAQFLAV